jgi:putative transcription factor
MYQGKSGQDWQVVTFATKKDEKVVKKEIVKAIKNPTTHQSTDINLQKLEKDEDYHIERVSSTLRQNIIQARLSAKLTQIQLAQKINEPVKTVQEYENGKAVPNNQVLQKMSRVLGVVLKKKI